MMTTEVALGHVGLILSIEVSRVARNNADWYRLLDLCGVTDTLIGDEDGLYHPGLFNDRLLLGLKGTMAEAELHVIRARLEGGIRNKAARGQLRRGLPVGFVWGEEDGEVLFHPDQAVTERHSMRLRQVRRDGIGSPRLALVPFPGIVFPLQSNSFPDIQWVTPTYTGIHQVLTNPVYAGAYVYGKTHQERFVDQSGRLRKRIRRLPRSQWAVLLHDHHKGFIDWDTYDHEPASHCQQYPSLSSSSHRSNPRRRGPPSRHGHLRPLRPSSQSVLSGPKLHPRLLLLGKHLGQRPRPPLFARRRGPDR